MTRLPSVTSRLLGGVWMLLAAVAACDSKPATAPSPVPTASGSVSVALALSGVATDDDGAPVAGASVTVTVDPSVFSAVTDETGYYSIAWGALLGGSASFGYIKADRAGHERFFAYLFSNSSTDTQNLTQNVRLYRITRITAGESILVTVRPGDSTCGEDDELTCRTVRVIVPATGRLTMTCEPRGNDNGGPGLTIEGYNDRIRSGQPWYVVQGEVSVNVGMWFTSTVTQSCLLTTSFQPSLAR